MTSNASPFFTRAQEARMSAITAAPSATIETTPSGAPALTLKDRCDRCGAQAWLRATIANVDLLFCGHHAHKHMDALVGTSAQLHSELDKLEATHGPNAIREQIAAEESAKA